MRFKIRNLPWLAVLGLLIGTAVVSGAAAGPVALALIALYLGAVAFSSFRFDFAFNPARLLDAPRASLAAAATPPEARQAAERARRRGGLVPQLVLADIGLIATSQGPDGILMRRTRSASADDDGLRPYVTLRVPAKQADRAARIRFEMIDGPGQTRYIHEMRTMLRDGDVSVLADHHLPLSKGADPGDWDLRISVDGVLIAMHSFQVIASTRGRFDYLGTEGQRSAPPPASSSSRGRRLITTDDSIPLSLEDLLRNNQVANGNGQQANGNRANGRRDH